MFCCCCNIYNQFFFLFCGLPRHNEEIKKFFFSQLLVVPRHANFIHMIVTSVCYMSYFSHVFVIFFSGLVFTMNIPRNQPKRVENQKKKSSYWVSVWTLLRCSQIFLTKKIFFVRMHTTLQYFACLTFSHMGNVSSGWDK